MGLECYAKKKRFEFEEGQGPLKNIIIILIIIEMSPLEELVVPYISSTLILSTSMDCLPPKKGRTCVSAESHKDEGVCLLMPVNHLL